MLSPDAPVKIRATRGQLQLLIDIVSNDDVPQDIRHTAKAELEKALTLDAADE